jgi:hypothetical protein
MKFEKDDIVQCNDTRSAKHLQWNTTYRVAWCSEKYVRLAIGVYSEDGRLRPTMYSVDRFEKVLQED